MFALESSSLPESFVFIMPVNLTHSLTRACFCFATENPMQTTYTNMCANYANLRVRQVNWKPTANLHIGQLWHDFCAARAANTKKKKTQKYFVSMKSRNSLFLCLFSKTISLIFRKSIYALSMPICLTPAQSFIKFKKISLDKYVFSAKSTHTLWLFLNKQINQSVEETISCNSRPKASD